MAAAYRPGRTPRVVGGPEPGSPRQLDRWAAQIEGALIEEADLHDDALPVDQWREALDDFRSSLDVERS